MFSPPAKKSSFSTRKERTHLVTAPPESPVTPVTENLRSTYDGAIPNRPSTGTPAPWASRLSVLARIPPARKSEKGDGIDPVQPIYVGEFPQVVRDEQTSFLHKRVSGDSWISGGMDSETSLAWMLCGNRLFIWSFLSAAASKKCVILDIPLNLSHNDNNWLLCVLNWDSTNRGAKRVVKQCNTAGVILFNQKTRALIYWPDIYSESGTTPVVDTDDSEGTFDGETTPNKQMPRGRTTGNSMVSSYFNSLIASAVIDMHNTCIALACSSNGQLWRFLCSPTSIQHERVLNISGISSQDIGGKGYPRSLRWCPQRHSLGQSKRQFLLLTDHEIHCFSVKCSTDFSLSKLWSHEIIGTDGDSGIQKGLAGQKRIWPLDMEIGNQGNVITVLIATFCKDRVSSSSYIEYSLLTMQNKPGVDIFSDSAHQIREKVLEKKAPIQVIIPKARVEEEDFLFSMRLKVGGKPSGSAIILSGDGTATVAHYWRNANRLYQFDLPYDAGKVLDASIFPSDEGEDGSWAVLTEKAGVWAIPEKAVLLGGVEPPERSLSRKGSSNEGSVQEEKRNFSFAGDIAPRRASSEAWDAGDRQRPAFPGITRRTAQDEDSEELLNHLFHEFLLSGQVNGVLDKLQDSGAFERDGETNVFSRISKSIVDTLAKHWTTTRGVEIVALSVVSSQLVDKQQKHQKFLHFLALSKCHEQLRSRQTHALQIIVEHGEKLAGMIKLRELQSMNSERQSTRTSSAYSPSEGEISGPLWELIQLVGERARRNTVLLMDRDNAEVFYSKVSDMEELFYCLDKQLEYIISEDMPFKAQLQRAFELSNACVTVIHTAMQYRDEHHMWYPYPEGLTPWYCQTVVRCGLWKIASYILHLLSETNSIDVSTTLDFHSYLKELTEVLLEAYSGAMIAKVDRGEEHRGLLDEYWTRKDALLDALYQQVLSFVEARHQGSGEGTEEQNEQIFRKLSSDLLSIAKRHGGHQTLWNMCCDLNDEELLKSLMRESTGPKGGYSYFVFQQLHNSGQYSKLMRLGEDFPEELLSFLKQHKNLLWLHQVFLHQFPSASETLHVLALSQNDNSGSVAEGTESFDSSIEATLSDRKRLLHLSKIAAVAGITDDCDTKMRRIEADLKILKLQEEIFNLVPEEQQNIGQRCLPPVDLIELCLKSENRDLSLHAFDVFAFTSSSFIKSNMSLLEECWRNAANMDQWDQIYQSSIAEGWSDEETLGFLRETILFQASSRCFGPEAESFEGGFDEVLPLRQENSDMGSTVEAILMQHKNFPDAGKLMLTAVMLGSLQVDDTKMEGSPMPME